MDMSTNVFAAGCTMSRSFMMVAPSFDIVVFCPSKTSLSIPLGPKVVRIVSATAWHALMFDIICDFPWLVSVPSLRRII